MLSLLGAAATLGSTDLYKPDPSWSPQFPPGAHTFSAVAVHNREVFVSQRGNVGIDPVVVLSKDDGTLLRSWGKDAVATSNGTWGAHGLQVCGKKIWIDDFFGHTLRAFTPHGQLLLTAGTVGIAGNATWPKLQFDHVADTVCDGVGGV